jgi:hypothetical protein
MNWEVVRQSNQNGVYHPQSRQGKSIASAQARGIEGPLKDWIDNVLVPAMLPIYLAAGRSAAENSVSPVMESVH